MRFVTGIFAGITTMIILYAIVAAISKIPYGAAAYVLIGLGAIALLISIARNISRNSPIKIGAANRAEFYSVVVILIGFMFTINLRVDALYQIMITK